MVHALGVSFLGLILHPCYQPPTLPPLLRDRVVGVTKAVPSGPGIPVCSVPSVIRGRGMCFGPAENMGPLAQQVLSTDHRVWTIDLTCLLPNPGMVFWGCYSCKEDPRSSVSSFTNGETNPLGANSGTYVPFSSILLGLSVFFQLPALPSSSHHAQSRQTQIRVLHLESELAPRERGLVN